MIRHIYSTYIYIYIYIYIRQIFGISTRIYTFPSNSEKDVRFKNRKYDLEDDIVGVSITWYSSGQSFIKLLKLIGRELDMVAMNN